MEKVSHNSESQNVVVNPPVSKLAHVNAILNSKSISYYSGEYQGTLSVKCAFGGQATYEAAGERFAVDDTAYLLLNNRQTYAMTIEAETTVETFCLIISGPRLSASHGRLR